MKSVLTVISLFIISLSVFSQKGNVRFEVYGNNDGQETIEIKANRHSKKALNDFKYLKGDIPATISYGIFIARPTDTALLLINNTIHEKIQPDPFYMLEHEITNSNYREFIAWVKDSVKRSVLAKKGFGEFLLANGNLNYDIPILESPDIKSALEELYIKEESGFFGKVYFNNELLQVPVNGEMINVYPDISCSTKILGNYSKSIQTIYLSHPSYDNYPIVGISYKQALAYCYYLNQTLALEIAKQLKLPAAPVFRLPTEKEWIYAAASLEKSREKQKSNNPNFEKAFYPFTTEGTQLFDYNYEEKSMPAPIGNYGAVKDQNNLISKTYVGDNALFTAQIKSYAANDNGLYDLAGNTAEWTMSKPSKLKHVILSSDEQTDTLWVREGANFQQLLEDISIHNTENPETVAKAILHDITVLKDTSDLRVIKGGSWDDPPVYLLNGSREVRKEDYSDARIGFRIVMEAYVKKKNTIYSIKK